MERFSRILGLSFAASLGAVALTVPASGVASAAALGAKPAASTAAAHNIVAVAAAYGTKVSGSVLVSSGPTAPVTLGGCSVNTTGPITKSVASVNLPLLGSTGTLTDSVAATVNKKSGNTSAASSTVQGVSLLSGLLTAEAVGSLSTSTLAGGTYGSQGSTDIVSLVVAGQAVAASPPPNTKLGLPGFGSITLNQQTVSGSSLTVNAIAIRVTKNNTLGLPIGVKIVIGHSVSGFTSSVPVVARVAGHAYGTSVEVGTVISSGETAPVSIGCLGTDGKTHTTNVAGITVPVALTTGTITSTAEGDTSSTTAHVVTTNTIEAANVLGSLVSATAVTASAEATDDAGTITTSAAGSGFVGLAVTGFPSIGDNIPANTKLAIPGIGTLYLHRVITTPKGIQVRMIELVITSSVAPLPVGTEINVAVAGAHIR